ncbi:hypothetical protein AQ490_09285 [Wenjunlia vitaminophila]|uniref:Acyl-CoA carboxylase subunit epsilon n=1 Tax=Wenjunlia vitaminophila TaxID=76728 RepID=A0A0T6LLH1_WENVI|nr:acyl-CoA carboxylase epsilon subunit [Wenjunlia vitaminophila]KRV46951.1 hypothetical protein AQ490_09285 [Wenjunlia vitaminophila]
MNVVRGNPTPEELAALVAVVAAARARAAAVPARGPVSVWAQRARNIRPVPHPGPAAWRSSAWPR